MKRNTLCSLVLLSLVMVLSNLSAHAVDGIGTWHYCQPTIIKLTNNPDMQNITDVQIDNTIGGDDVTVAVLVEYGDQVTINSVELNIRRSGIYELEPFATLTLSHYSTLPDLYDPIYGIYTHRDIYTTTLNTIPEDADTRPLTYRNGEHAFSARVFDSNAYMQEDYQVDSEEILSDIRNLWITGTSYDPPYFLRSVGETSPTEITITFDHYLLSDSNYTVEVTIRKTATNQNTEAILTTTTVTHDGTSHSATLAWNPAPGDYPWGGYFCFDVKVSHGADEITLCSPTCSVTSDDVYFIDDTTAGFEYSLSEEPMSGSVSVDFFEDLMPLSTESGISEQVRNSANPVTTTISSDVMSIRAILTGRDNHTDNRGQVGQQFLPTNNGKGHVLYQALAFTLTNSADSVLQLWQKKLNLDTGTYDQAPTVIASYTANSGRSTKHASEPRTYAYLNNPSAMAQANIVTPGDASFGPCPAQSSCELNTVTPPTPSIIRPWQVPFSPHPANETSNGWNSYLWRNTPTGTEKYEGFTVHEFYRAASNNFVEKRFYIYNNSPDSPDTHPISVGGFTANPDRSAFRIHEDTNYAYAGGEAQDIIKGSEGCIAVEPGSMQSVFTRINFMASFTWYTTYLPQPFAPAIESTSVPLSVFTSGGGTPSEWIYRKVRP